jgi:hypothetical protein
LRRALELKFKGRRHMRWPITKWFSQEPEDRIKERACSSSIGYIL